MTRVPSASAPMLYPLTFAPILKERLWGGRKLARLYGKPLPPEQPIGESWEISDRPGDVSVVVNGPLAGKDLHGLLQQHGAAFMGGAPLPEGRFPLLVKILDAREILSVQVHPPPHAAVALGGEPKTEFWYVAQAGPASRLSAGLKAGVSRAVFEARLREGTVDTCIHQVPVRQGDALFLPSGRIHALGADLVVFEMQQNSDTTYRVFDWNRVGPDGKPRELHLEAAMASIDFGDFEPPLVAAPWQPEGELQRRRLVDHPLFRVDELQAGQPARRTWAGGRVKIIGVVAGTIHLEHPASGERLDLGPGQFALLPAEIGAVEVSLARATALLEVCP